LLETARFARPLWNSCCLGGRVWALPVPEESEESFEGNALIKARAACRASGLPALADDSGLCVNALGGAPGVHTAEWGGVERDSKRSMLRIHTEMGDTPDRSAYFVAVLALVYPDGREEIFEGRCDGHLVWPLRGENGFGHDPMFVPLGENRTFAEMTSAEKKAYSHRARAFKKLIEQVFCPE
jgi:XTP/dITP diphosphohydrolase